MDQSGRTGRTGTTNKLRGDVIRPEKMYSLYCLYCCVRNVLHGVCPGGEEAALVNPQTPAVIFQIRQSVESWSTEYQSGSDCFFLTEYPIGYLTTQ